MHEFGGAGEVSDVFCAVAVAGEDDRDVVFAAAAPAEGHTPQYYHYSMFGREDQVAKR